MVRPSPAEQNARYAHSSPWASLTFSMATRTASMTKAKGFPFLLRVFIEAVLWVRDRRYVKYFHIPAVILAA